jgi:hypothetical protein
MGYVELTNTITTSFQDFADTNSYIVRYDNDPRDTPDGLPWLEVSVEFDSTVSRDIAVPKFRATGALRITITDDIGKGIYQVLAITDVIETQFSNTKISDVLFRTAMVIKRGRTSDNISNNRSGRQINSNQAANAGGGNKYQVDVTIPFQYDFTS